MRSRVSGFLRYGGKSAASGRNDESLVKLRKNEQRQVRVQKRNVGILRCAQTDGAKQTTTSAMASAGPSTPLRMTHRWGWVEGERAKTKYRDLSTARWTVRLSSASVEMTFVVGVDAKNKQQHDRSRSLRDDKQKDRQRPKGQATAMLDQFSVFQCSVFSFSVSQVSGIQFFVVWVTRVRDWAGLRRRLRAV